VNWDAWSHGATVTAADLVVENLGETAFASPLHLTANRDDGRGDFVSDLSRVLYRIEIHPEAPSCDDIAFEKAGPRERLFFDPAETRAAIVTCGGLCPGLNNVVRSFFLQMFHHYGVKELLGIRYGYEGLNPRTGAPPIVLTRDSVRDVHRHGGTLLGSSRGPQDPKTVVDFLLARGIDILVCVGGDGTQHGAHAIHEEVRRRGLPIAIVGIPKTIDNDIAFCTRSFGYSSALERARIALDCAHEEARGARNGIGLVKLMGRHAGFVSAGATLASGEVNFVLIPEVPFDLEGPAGFLAALERRINERGHALVVVAEGAGQQHLDGGQSASRDRSGNPRLRDIGSFLRERIEVHFGEIGVPIALKYIDPSYIIRSVPANGEDAVFCNALGRHAAHAAMAGRTNVLISDWQNEYVHVPIPLVGSREKRIRPGGEIWRSVIQSTGQPARFGAFPDDPPA